jgi:hypothetical protein
MINALSFSAFLLSIAARMNIQLSTLSVILGLIVALPSVYGLLNPKSFAVAAQKFPRHTTVGWGLMLMGTAWFLFNVRQETVSDFAAMQNIFLLVFGGVGIMTCIFVQDFLPVRGLAVLLLLAAKLMVDTARWEDTEWRLVISTWAYVWAVAGMWFTVSPWRLRDLVNWSVATEQRTRMVNGARVAFGVFVILLGVTVFRTAEKHSAAETAQAPAVSLRS